MTRKARSIPSESPVSVVVKQVGGTHYGAHRGMCPNCGAQIIEHWDLYAKEPYLEGVATGYVTRWREKGGLQDLRKAISVIEKLIAIELLREIGSKKAPTP